MELVKADITFLYKICTWLIDKQNFIDCGGKADKNNTWLEIFVLSSKFWDIGRVYKIVNTGEEIGFIVIEKKTFHTFLLPEHRTNHSYSLLSKVFDLMFNVLNQNKIFTLTNDERVKKYLIRQNFKQEDFTRHDYKVFSLTKRKYLKCQ